MTDRALLSLEDLHVTVPVRDGELTPVDGISLEVKRGEVLGIAGESGSGKSLTLKAILGLLPLGSRVDGEIRFSPDGSPPETFDPVDLRGHGISMIFQEPMTALNPTMRVGNLIALGYRLHHDVTRAEAKVEAIRLMREVGIPAPERRYKSWPHQLSGGLRQRVVIAAALSTRPKLLLCDEPTTALDVTISRQILALLKRLADDRDMGLIYVTHDLPVLGQFADRIGIIYAGRLVEVSPTEILFSSPKHPYTHALLHSAPVLDRTADRLEGIGGRPPDPRSFPPGCRFSPRCPYAAPECDEAPYRLAPVDDTTASACIFNHELAGVR